MSQTIEAIYENGVFKPLRPVDLPEGTRVQVAATGSLTETDEPMRQQLIADGASPDEAEAIIDNFRLLWGSYDSLTEEQKEALDQSRLDQEHFFDHEPSV